MVPFAAAGTWRQRGFASAVTDDVEDPPPPPKESSPSSEVKVVPPEETKVLEMNLRPSDVVTELNKHIVGQDDAKKAVAIAMRNRWRRMQLPDDLKKEVTPRNVLLVGPTGCGKTEVARRMAMLNDAPFRTFENDQESSHSGFFVGVLKRVSPGACFFFFFVYLYNS